MASTTTIYRSVTLAAGEPFSLPHGGVLVSAENVGALTSECPLGTVEDLGCYTAVVAFAGNDGDPTQAWELGDSGDPDGAHAQLDGISIKTSSSPATYVAFAVSYTFLDPIGIVGGTAPLIAELTELLPGAFNIQVGQDLSDFSRRYKLYVTVKTTLSVACSLYLNVSTQTAGNVPILVPFRLHSTVEDEGHLSLPTCTVSIG